MDYLKEINDIYENQILDEGYRGMSYNRNPNNTYTPQHPHKHSYRGSLPFNAGGSDNVFARNSLNTHTTVISDDEEDIITGNIDKRRIIDLIDKLIAKADTGGMDYAVFALGQVKQFIKQN